ncbi:metal-dependent transcriptional regulator [Arthrobacter monumenti]
MSPAARNSPGLSSDSASVQDYVKVIYAFTEWQDKPVTMTALAARLKVANSSVTEMVRKLVDLGLADHKPYNPVELTPEGLRLALSMVRRHRLLETYLVQELGYGWDEVHNEAELLEHTVSDTLVDRMSARLGHPDRDPHGDPIPSADGTIELPAAHVLSTLDEGHHGRVARISDANPHLLRYLGDEEIRLDTAVTVLGRKPFGGALTVQVGSGGRVRELDLGDELAASVWVMTEGRHEGCTLEKS